MTRHRPRWLRNVLALATIAIASHAIATPVTLEDTNGTRYKINTETDPMVSDSLASGAITLD